MTNLTAQQVDYGILASLATLSPATAREAIDQHRIEHALFQAPGAVEVFCAIRNTIASGDSVHVVRLASAIPAAIQKAMGGPDVLAKMCSPSVVDRLPPLPQLVESARRRQECNRVLRHAEKTYAAAQLMDVEGARQGAQQLLEAPLTESNEVFHVSEVSTRIRLQAEGRQAGKEPQSLVPSRIPSLDKRLGGGFPRNLVVIGSEGGRGKSGLAIRISECIARSGTGVGYITLEDAPETLLTRLVDDHPSVCLRTDQFHGATDLKHLDNLHTALGDLSTLPLWMTRHGRVSPRKLLSLADTMRHRGAGVVFIDNSNEMLFDSPEERHRAMDDVLQQLREWAIRWGVPVVFITHLTRDAKRTDADPIRRGDFAHSAGFERIARCMLGVRQVQLRDGHAMAIDCVKLTEGTSGWSIHLQMSTKAGVPTLFEAPAPPSKHSQAITTRAQIFETHHAD